MTEFVDIALNYLWLCDFITLMLFALITFIYKVNSSSVITQLLVVAASGVILKYSGWVGTFVGPDKEQSVLTYWYIGFALVDSLILGIVYWHYRQLSGQTSNIVSRGFALGGLVLLSYLVYKQLSLLMFNQTDEKAFLQWLQTAYYIGNSALAILISFVILKVHEFNKLKRTLIANMYLLAYFVGTIIYIAQYLELVLWQTNHIIGLYTWGMAGVNIGTSGVALTIASLAIYKHVSKRELKGAVWEL